MLIFSAQINRKLGFDVSFEREKVDYRATCGYNRGCVRNPSKSFLRGLGGFQTPQKAILPSLFDHFLFEGSANPSYATSSSLRGPILNPSKSKMTPQIAKWPFFTPTTLPLCFPLHSHHLESTLVDRNLCAARSSSRERPQRAPWRSRPPLPTTIKPIRTRP